MIGKWFYSLPFIFANKNYTLTWASLLRFSQERLVLCSSQVHELYMFLAIMYATIPLVHSQASTQKAPHLTNL